MKSKLLAFASAVMAFQFSFANPGPDDLPREWAIGRRQARRLRRLRSRAAWTLLRLLPQSF